MNDSFDPESGVLTLAQGAAQLLLKNSVTLGFVKFVCDDHASLR